MTDHETPAGLSEAEREALNVAVDEAETCACCGDAYGSRHVYAAVERILTARLAAQAAAHAEEVAGLEGIWPLAAMTKVAQLRAERDEWQEEAGRLSAQRDDLRAKVAGVEARLTREALCSPRNAALVADLRAVLATPPTGGGSDV